ncbi:MAG: hypothetical protein [Olavius algarvensis Gamma 3 endosymbiont]|nr:MAG: hypothetical protein [Olavius algarvensis Gamma 3 endosymbiont]
MERPECSSVGHSDSNTADASLMHINNSSNQRFRIDIP